MKTTFSILASALVLGAGAANAAAINPDTNACIAEVNTAMETNTLYDAFIPTSFLDEARVMDWKSPYSDTNATPVATVVMVEGKARERKDKDDTDRVTVKCGMDAGVVKAIEIMPGHGIEMVSPITATK